jgi:hypothetical protein
MGDLCTLIWYAFSGLLRSRASLEAAERFQARGIDPMCILEDHQYRLLACQPSKLAGQDFQRSLPPPFRGQLKRGIPSIIRQRQHLGKERGVLGMPVT